LRHCYAPESASVYSGLALILLCCATSYSNSVLPTGVIAAMLGHSDTRMTEKHYAHLAPSYVAQTIRANFPRLGLTEEPKNSGISKKALTCSWANWR
jgi:integrase